MRIAMLVSLIRPTGPTVVGISLGFTLSLLSVTWVDESCDFDWIGATDEMLTGHPGSSEGARKPISISTGTTDSGNVREDFEPRILPYNKPAQEGPPKKVFRVKYASTELGIHERLFVSVLTSKTTMNTLADESYTQPERLKTIVSHLRMDLQLYMGQPREFIGGETKGRMVKGGFQNVLTDHPVTSAEFIRLHKHFTVTEIQKTYEETEQLQLSSPQLVNGYRRMDHTRGMEYTLDLQFQATTESGHQKSISRRVYLVRPLSQVEVIPMPYVTEATRVHIFLPLTSYDSDVALRFLDHCSSNLFLFTYEPAKAQKVSTNDIFAEVKAKITSIEHRYPSVKVSWISIKTESPGVLPILDTVSRKHPVKHSSSWSQLTLYSTQSS
ncbi:hypothetical protein cypCar_00002491 [Cyprinus carpio]|nr:hypothetical protein cypCar_00002491 [Cyprinus carpio]